MVCTYSIRHFKVTVNNAADKPGPPSDASSEDTTSVSLANSPRP